jgi:GT2 family glycosyltransferase/glycosyltransferase involved in cell wall biosynthesis
MTVKLTAILTCHNRQKLTIECLRSFFRQQLSGDRDMKLAAVVVDDGSTDGTAAAVRAAFPRADVVIGSGNLFWAGGMALAESEAWRRSPDFLLWLNDDVELDPDALSRLVRTSREWADDCIVVGALRDPATGQLTYSGIRRRGMHPMHFVLVPAVDKPVPVDTFNGNTVLIPQSVAARVGLIDARFAHAAADFDYGLRAAAIGIPSILAPGTVGTCRRDAEDWPWLDETLPFRTRLSLLLGPKGAPFRSSARYLRRHGGALWPLFWTGTYVRFGVGALRIAMAPKSRFTESDFSQDSARVASGNNSGGDAARHDAPCADYRASADSDAFEDDRPRADENVIPDFDGIAGLRVRRRLVAPRHRLDDVEVCVRHQYVRAEQHTTPHGHRDRSADGRTAHPYVGADHDPRATSQRAQDYRAGDAQRSRGGARDEDAAVSDGDRRFIGKACDRVPEHSNPFAQADAATAEQRSPERGRNPVVEENGHAVGDCPKHVSPYVAKRCRPAIRGVVITGPLSPADIAHRLTGQDARLASCIQGYRGIPTLALIEAFLDEGAQVEAVTTAHEIEEAIDLRGEKLRVLVAPMRSRARDRALDLFREERRLLARLLASTEGNVVSAQWTYEFAWAALDDRRPVLVTAQDAPLTVLRHYRDAYRAFRTVMAYVVRARTAELAAVSPYLAGRWRREMLYRRPIAVLPNVAPLPPSSAGQAARRNGVELVAVADASPLKNVDSLIRAHASLRATSGDVVLNLVGPGLGPEDEAAARWNRQGLDDGVVFHGTLDRHALARVLRRSRVFVHPSLEESFGMVIVEAAAAGLPIVGGIDSGGVPWVLADGRAGVLVDVRRPEAIATAVSQLLADERNASAMVARAQDYIARSFGPSVVATAYFAAFDRLGTRRGAAA